MSLNVAILFYRNKKRNSQAFTSAKHVIEIIDDHQENEELESGIQLLHKFINQMIK